MSIEHLIINITARAFERYLEQVIPSEVKEMVLSNKIDPNILVDLMASLAQVAGHGKYEWVGYRYENDPDDYTIQQVSEPHSLPFAVGGFIGALSAAVGGEHAVTYKEIGPDKYEFKSHWAEYPAVLKEKLRLIEHRHGDGDIELESCGTCGGPRGLSDFKWYPERGVILSRQTGRRMSMLGPAMMDPIFIALEAEIDETIPQVVVEAQRRFVKTGFYPLNILESKDDLRNHLALRGLGNLRSIDIDRKGARMRLDNTCLHLLMVGLVQGIYELTFDVESNVEWELSEEGDLDIEVTSR